MSMQRTRTPMRAWISVTLAVTLSACATSKKDIFPQDMAPMTEIYSQHFKRLRTTEGVDGARERLHERKPQTEEHGNEPISDEGASEPMSVATAEGSLHSEDVGLEGYTRAAGQELDALFPLLPNPTLVMYVYPHLAEGGVGVPGYATQFRFYERDEYALPGEAPVQATNR